MVRIFIDGATGTTALLLQSLLEKCDGVELLDLGAQRKARAARADALNASDLAILCLPDEAAKQAVRLISNDTTRVIDASTAHRVNTDWVFGFAEMDAGAAQRIRQARFVSNPGCYSIAAIALLRPLIAAEILSPGTPLAISGVSGYSGGGKQMVAEFANPTDPFFLYALSGTHKHLPEIQKYSGLTHAPIFTPSVGNFAQGMIVTLPLHAVHVRDYMGGDQLAEIYAKYYEASPFISVMDDSPRGYERLVADNLVGTNNMQLAVHQQDEGYVLSALLDNLGKGATRNVLQNINIMFDLNWDENIEVQNI